MSRVRSRSMVGLALVAVAAVVLLRVSSSSEGGAGPGSDGSSLETTPPDAAAGADDGLYPGPGLAVAGTVPPEWPVTTGSVVQRLPPGSVAPSPSPDGAPSAAPGQFDDGRGAPPPPNQWWTSAAVGPGSEPLWAHPLAVQVRDDGFALSGAAAEAGPDAIVTPFDPDLRVVLADAQLTVTGSGAFSVDLSVAAADGSVRTSVVQGSPLVTMAFDGPAPVIEPGPGAIVELSDTGARIDVGGRTWDLVTDAELRWDGTALGSADSDALITVAVRPDEVDLAAWHAALEDAAWDPVVTTSATSTLAAGPQGDEVTQRLRFVREGGGSGPVALLPHQVARASSAVADAGRIGTYRHARGTLEVVVTDTVELLVPAGVDPTLGWPDAALDDAARAAVLDDLDADLADASEAGGSYFGAKELGRLATIAEVAEAVGADDRRDVALERLRPLLLDWLTYDGEDDPRYLALEPTWGGVVAHPAEFGLEDYNDHHFQYGYLVRAAAVLAAYDEDFVDRHGPVIDLLVDAYTPRVFQPWAGHSAASGFAPFVDGNNQESSSEAVAAWEAAARWGEVAGRDELVELARSLLAIEAETARTYWLGESPGVRPEGYEHVAAGILFDAKVDFATWFSADPEAIVGIQLLPLTPASAYRSDPEAAQRRAGEVEELVGGHPRSWGDLFAADLAIADPDAARARIDAGVPREPSTSRAAVRYWIEVQAGR